MLMSPSIRIAFASLLLLSACFSGPASAQTARRDIPLPQQLRATTEEFSGMAVWKDRLYLLPQYGSNKDSVLRGDFFLYSIRLDSIRRVLDHKDTALTAYRTIRLAGINALSDTIRWYQGMEAISIIDGRVFLSIETDDEKNRDCYVITGLLDRSGTRIDIDPKKVAVLPRFSFIPNAGFESLAWLPSEKKLLALFEFNAAPSGNHGYLIDPTFKTKPRAVSVPFSYFRVTDAVSTPKGVFALNYFWNGDYRDYLNNCIVRAEESLADSVPSLRRSLMADTGYLRGKTNCFTRIIRMKQRTAARWTEHQVIEYTCSDTNWEGLVPFGNGFLIISDANGKKYLRTVLSYIPAP
ncbi:MAG: hypothetical protein JWP27_1398 [Flaviaesturariibacter sp.]|nr:hypothetical protein [Flaviaesturariibacter sp.]